MVNPLEGLVTRKKLNNGWWIQGSSQGDHGSGVLEMGTFSHAYLNKRAGRSRKDNVLRVRHTRTQTDRMLCWLFCLPLVTVVFIFIVSDHLPVWSDVWTLALHTNGALRFSQCTCVSMILETLSILSCYEYVGQRPNSDMLWLFVGLHLEMTFSRSDIKLSVSPIVFYGFR